MEKIRRYYDRSAASLERKKLACDLDAEETEDILSSIPGETNSLLDVGCGTGHLLDRAPGKMRVGVDFSISMLNLGLRRGSGCILVLADVRRLPFKEGLFQVVVSQDTIGHFRDPGRLASEMVRMCAPGGLMIVTGSRTTLMSRMVSLYSRACLGVYARSYGLKRLEKIFEMSGAKPISSDVIGNSIVILRATR